MKKNDPLKLTKAAKKLLKFIRPHALNFIKAFLIALLVKLLLLLVLKTSA